MRRVAALCTRSLDDHLRTMDIKMARTFEEWLKLFDLKCDSMDDFLAFYSGVCWSVCKLEQQELVAITDDASIRAFLCRALDVLELQNTAKELKMNTNLSVMKIFEPIHKEYNALNTTSALRDTEMTLTRSTRRAEVRPGARSGEVKGKPASVSRFPPNTHNLIPHSSEGL